MELYGTGAIKDPVTGKVIWDFEDGPFETEDQKIIDAVTERSKAKVERKPTVQAETIEDVPMSESDYKESLVEKAVALNLGAPSTLRRWSVEKLEKAIAEQEDEPEDESE